MFGIKQIQKHGKNLVILPAVAAFVGLAAYQKQQQADRSWGTYKADAASTSYSALNQINTSNVGQLELAWTHSYADMKDGSRAGSSECNPIIVDGVMYTTSAKHWAYAINAQTGEQLWAFDPFDGAEGG